MKINKIIGLMLALIILLTFGCITTTFANPDIDRKIENAKVWQEGDKVCIGGYYSTLDGTPVYNAQIQIRANYDNGLTLLCHGTWEDTTPPWDCYVGESSTTDWWHGVYMITDKNGYFEIKLDAGLIKRNDLQIITLENTYYTDDVKVVVFDREFDGSIVDYLDNQK